MKDISSWESIGILTPEDKENLTFNECKEKAVELIYNKYSQYIKVDLFSNVYLDIKEINKSEVKPIEAKFLKFNEEYGEFVAEFLKFKGYTYKPYNKQELMSEMADTLQVLLSIYNAIEVETDITIDEVLNEITVKNKKWADKIKEYKINGR